MSRIMFVRDSLPWLIPLNLHYVIIFFKSLKVKCDMWLIDEKNQQHILDAKYFYFVFFVQRIGNKFKNHLLNFNLRFFLPQTFQLNRI